MKQYHDLLQHILDHGKYRDDRTGTGTYSVFGYQMRFNLQDGFPLLTTKKLHIPSIFHEVIWYLRGESNIKYLSDNNVKIWDAWSSATGELGPVYPAQWRHFGRKPLGIKQPTPKLREGLGATYLGVGNGKGKTHHPLGKTWEGIMSRCYNVNDVGYADYGGKGVHVCDRWLEFAAFASDAEKLPGWEEKQTSKQRYVIDKDINGDGFVYSPTSCTWVTDSVNGLRKNLNTYCVEKDGEIYLFNNPASFCREHGISDKNFSDLWSGNKNAKVRYGFRLVSVSGPNEGVDQIANVIKEIKDNPSSRRLIVNAWNVGDLKYMALPPCHAQFQFYVDEGKLSCHLYQRSADCYLGIPFNIASYALLTHMIAHITELDVGELIISLGDAHLYADHVEQARLQLTREPYPLPQLRIKRKVTDIDDFKYEDFEVVGYQAHPHIKARVSV